MIHVTYGQNLIARLSLLESKINTTVDESKLRWLFKFTNDLTKSVQYAYATIVSENDRYVENAINHNTTPDIFSGRVDFKPYGHWSYEVYEVSWIGTVGINDTNAPNSETEVLSTSIDNGVVEGKVHEGKVYVSETVGSEQIKYTTHTEASGTNYLYAN